MIFSVGADICWKCILVDIIFDVISAIIDVFTFIYLFNVKTTNKAKVEAIISVSSLRLLSKLLIPTPFNRAFNLIVSVVIWKLIFKTKIEKCILGQAIISTMIISTECVFSKILCMLMPGISTYTEGIYTYEFNFWMMLSISLVRMIALIVILKRKLVLNINDNLTKTDRNSIIAVSVIGAMLIYFNAVEMTMYISNFPYSIFVLDIVSLILYFFISIKCIFRIIKLEKQDRIINNLENYNKRLSIMYDSTRVFRHDFSNFVQALDGYAKTNDIEGVKRMSEAVTKECKDVNNMSILDSNILRNSAVDNIITNKYFCARDNDITINLDVLTDLEETKEYSYEFCRILSILLDNAIEAAKDSEDKIINIRIMKDLKINRKLIIIENTYNDAEELDVDKIFEKGYTTKNDTKKEHGLGLWTVKKTLGRIENLNLYTTKGEYFTQQIEIYE